MQDPQGTVTEYVYDNRGEPHLVVAAQGNTEQNFTAMTYDSLGRKTTMIDPDMGYWTYQYDKAGNLTSQTDAMGQTLNFGYDVLGRITQKIYPDHTVTCTYDNSTITFAAGMLTKVSDPSGGESKEDRVLQLDVMQRITKSRKSIGSNAVTIGKAYDSSGRVITLTYFPGAPTQRVYRYAYDAAGNLTSLRDDTGSKDIVQYTNFTALGQARMAAFPKPNNISVQTTYTYNPATSRMSTLLTQKLQSGTPVATYQNLSYDQFDGKGNLIHLTDTQNNLSHSYSYDSLDRLLTAGGTGSNPYTQSYLYDRIGNITYKSDVGAYSYIYGNKPHAVRSAGSMTFQYDANGRMTQRTAGGITLGISWNADNMPTLIKKNNSDYMAFTYDGKGQRVRKQNLWSGQSTLYFGEAYEMRGNVGVIHLFCGPHRVASIRTDGKDQYYHGNHLGSASVITNSSGDRKERVEYFPFGAYRERTDYDASFPNANYTFTDQEDDDELGFYNYKARLYDPALGRFISADTIVQAPGDPQSLNRYSYCRNNPLVYADPSGHFFGIDDLIIGIIIGAALGAIVAALTQQNIGFGALTGGITGLFLSGAGTVIGACGKAGITLTAITKAGIYAAAGASAGAINAGISGSDIGIGALSGGAFAAAAYALPAPKFKIFGEGPADTLANRVGSIGNRIINSSLTGAAFGGVSAGMTGGDILQGMAMGAVGWAAGSAGNMLIGHAAGFVGSSFEAPTFKDGVFIYGGNSKGYLTIGNVVWQAPEGMSPSLFVHEQTGHGTFQSNLLGPAYLPAHLLDKMTFSLMLEYSQPLLGGAPTYYDLYLPQNRPWTWWSIFK